MLAPDNIKTTFDRDLIELSSLVVRNVRDKTEDGFIIELPELQFQVKNITNGPLVGLEVEVNFYTANGDFVGTDSDLRLDILKSQEVETFALFIEPPEKATSAELLINIRRYLFKDKINKITSHPVALFLLIMIFIYFVYLGIRS